jgi:hypothetical protein
MNITIAQSRVLVVEGKDEERFFGALLNRQQISGVRVLGIAGKTNLRSSLRALVLTPDFKRVVRLGIVRDADNDFEAAFQSVCAALTAAELAAPPATSVAYGTSPSVAVLIVPSDGLGDLEDVCLEAVNADPVMPCLSAFFDCIEPLVGLPRHLGKAKVQVFLASRPEEGKRLGEAAEAGYWPWEGEAFKVIIDFVQLIATE